MALIKCPECGNEISDTADVCVNCGYLIKAKRKYYKIRLGGLNYGYNKMFKLWTGYI